MDDANFLTTLITRAQVDLDVAKHPLVIVWLVHAEVDMSWRSHWVLKVKDFYIGDKSMFFIVSSVDEDLIPIF